MPKRKKMRLANTKCCCNLKFYLSNEHKGPKPSVLAGSIWHALKEIEQHGFHKYHGQEEIIHILRDKANYHSRDIGYKGYTSGEYNRRPRNSKPELTEKTATQNKSEEAPKEIIPILIDPKLQKLSEEKGNIPEKRFSNKAKYVSSDEYD